MFQPRPPLTKLLSLRPQPPQDAASWEFTFPHRRQTESACLAAAAERPLGPGKNLPLFASRKAAISGVMFFGMIDICPETKGILTINRSKVRLARPKK